MSRRNHAELDCKFIKMSKIDPYGGGVEFDITVSTLGKIYQFYCRKKDVYLQLLRLEQNDALFLAYELCQDPELEDFKLIKYVSFDKENQPLLLDINVM